MNVTAMEEPNQPLQPPFEDSTASLPAEDAGAAPAAPVETVQSAEPLSAEAPPPGVEQAMPAPVAEQPAGEPPAEPTVSEAMAEPTVPEPPAEPTVSEPPAEPAVPEAAVEPAPVTEETREEPTAEAAAPPPPVKKPPRAADEVKEEEAEPTVPPPKSDDMNWYILKVQSNREDSIREGLLRRVGIAGLDYYFGDVIVPMERVTEFKGGKKRVLKRKLYPGYLVVQMEINDDTWFLVRETPGIGDFTGAAGRPTPMHSHEIERILAKTEEKSEKAPKLKIGFNEGDRVKIKDGTFESFEGQVDNIDQTNGQVTVMINIFGRSTPVTLEYWQIEAL